MSLKATKAAQLASVSLEAVSKVTSVGKVRKEVVVYTFDDHNAFVICKEEQMGNFSKNN